MNNLKAIFFSVVTIAVLGLSWASAHARYIGAEAPSCCKCGSRGPCPDVPGGSAISLVEGNLKDHYVGITAKSAFGPTLDFSLAYNSKAADGSQSRTNTVMGYGWTHSYNVLLFAQLGHMFRMDGDGRVTKYKLGAGGIYTVTPGYFETLVRNPNGTFTLRQKDGTTFDFALVSGTPFLIGGPVYRLMKITDRTGNITQLTYTSDKLTTITDTYGRQITLGYSGNSLATISDPMGRVTQLSYDLNGTLLTKITDPEGDSVQYSYNALAQMVGKVDKDGRVFSYQYNSTQKPVAIIDGAGNSRFALTNPSNWATDDNALASSQVRVYQASTSSKTDGNGKLWSYDYDSNGYITRVAAPAPESATTRYSYDPVTLQVAARTDANLHTTSYQYDGNGNLITKTDPSPFNYITSYAYEPTFSMMIKMTDANGRVTTYQYDARGNRIGETDPLGGIRRWTYDTHGNVLTDQDKNGNITTYGYDAAGNLATITDAVGNVTTMTYDAVGNLTSRTNARGFTTHYLYDGLNRLVQETDALNHTTETIYDGEGNRIQVIDRNGNATRYQYDLRQRLVATIDALNQTATYTYDGNDNRISATDKNGHTTTMQYDVQNRLNQTKDALGNVTSFTYDPLGNRLTETDANGHATTYSYDEINRRVSTLDAENNLTRIEYDRVGISVPSSLCPNPTGPTRGSSLVTRRIDGNGKYTYFKYDGLDRPSCQIRKQTDAADLIDGDDAVTRYSYDAHGNRLTMTEPNNNMTSYFYDALNRQKEMDVKVDAAASDVTLTTYDENSNVKTVTAPNLNVAVNTYDPLDRLIRVDDSVGKVATYTYDPEGRCPSRKDGNDNGDTNICDAIHRIVRIIDALGRGTFYTYDRVGNLTSLADREGNVTTYEYDDINRRIRMTDALMPTGNKTEYQYDGVGNLMRIQITDGVDGKVEPTRYLYDKVDRMTEEIYPDGKARFFVYDAMNLTKRMDQIGQMTLYTYSDLYYLTKRHYVNPVHPPGPDDNMTYDLSGRMLTAERGGWKDTFNYDGASRVTRTLQSGRTFDYLYDIPGRKRTITYPGGRTIVETTDARTRLGMIDDGGSPPPIVQYSYDLGNRVLLRNYRNGTSASYSYNANNWIASLDHTKGVVRIAGFSYDPDSQGNNGYDNEGNKRFEQKLADGAGSDTRSEAYQYDRIYRLIDYKVGTLVGSTVPIPTTQTRYDVDGLGNWLHKFKDNATETRSYDPPYNLVNEITAMNITLPGSTESLSNDDNGNLTEDGRYRYAYDEENRLTAVTRKSDSALVGQYTYDALGRRIVKIASPAGTMQTTAYFYDGARIVEEQDSGGATRATYVYGNYIDEVLSMDRDVQTFYYHQNSLWSVEAISNAAGTVVERYTYDAYGLPVVLSRTGASGAPNGWGTSHSIIGNPWLFTGRQFDEETGLYFYRARYYDSTKGRFLTRDPLDYEAGMNLYSYVRDNPANHSDAFGLIDDLCSQINTPAPLGKVRIVRKGYPNAAEGSRLDVNFTVIPRWDLVAQESGKTGLRGVEVEVKFTQKRGVSVGQERELQQKIGSEVGAELKGVSSKVTSEISETLKFSVVEQSEYSKEITRKVPIEKCSEYCVKIFQAYQDVQYSAVYQWVSLTGTFFALFGGEPLHEKTFTGRFNVYLIPAHLEVKERPAQ